MKITYIQRWFAGEHLVWTERTEIRSLGPTIIINKRHLTDGEEYTQDYHYSEDELAALLPRP